jgi:anti-sigma regulatory factor (Ser/Thr protein kinase)
MDLTEQRQFPARMAMLAETAAFVETFCARRGVGQDAALRLVLIVEELFTNTVTHGLGESAHGIRLTRDDDHVEVCRDRAPPYGDERLPVNAGVAGCTG